MAVIALDVGGSSIKSGLIIAPGRASSPIRHTTIDSLASADHILESLAVVIREYIMQPALEGIALAFPGPFDYPVGVSHITGLAKYAALYGLNVRDGLHARADLAALPIRFRNDAEAAIVGEALYGTSRGLVAQRVIGITLGTGFGSAFLIDGVPQRSGVGVPPNGWLYPEPVDAFGSGNKRADDVFSTRGLLGWLKSLDASVESVAEAAIRTRSGDKALRMGFEAFGHALGVFLKPYVRQFGADRVLLLGGIARSFDLFDHALQGGLHTSISVSPGGLGDVAALLGAAALFFSGG